MKILIYDDYNLDRSSWKSQPLVIKSRSFIMKISSVRKKILTVCQKNKSQLLGEMAFYTSLLIKLRIGYYFILKSFLFSFLMEGAHYMQKKSKIDCTKMTPTLFIPHNKVHFAPNLLFQTWILGKDIPNFLFFDEWWRHSLIHPKKTRPYIKIPQHSFYYEIFCHSWKLIPIKKI